VTCLRPVYQVAGKWWHEHGDCGGPRKIRALPAEPGDWVFGAIHMICGYCGEHVSWPELHRSWVRLTGAWLLAVRAGAGRPAPTCGKYYKIHKPGELVVLAETEGIAAHPGQRGTLPHYCRQIPASVQAEHAAEDRGHRRRRRRPGRQAVDSGDLEASFQEAQARGDGPGRGCARLPPVEAEALLATRGEHPVAVAYGPGQARPSHPAAARAAAAECRPAAA